MLQLDVILDGLTLTGILTGVRILWKNKYLRSFIIRMFQDFFKILIGNKLLTHNIFKSEKQKYYIIDNLDLITDLKTDLLQILLRVKTKIVTAYLKDYILLNKKNFNKWSKIELKKSIESLIKNMLYGDNADKIGYELEIERRYRQKYGNEKGTAYCSIVYHLHFKEYHDKNIGYIDSFLDTIFLYEKNTNVEIVEFIMDRFNMALSIAIDDAARTAKEINGTLEKL